MIVAFYIVFLLIFGSLNTLTTKWQFSMEAIGADGKAKGFEKPWWGNFAMFLAMIAVYGVYLIDQWRLKRRGVKADNEEPLLDGEEAPRKKFWEEFSPVFLPAFLDLTSSGLNFMGLLCISASVWQMLRGSMIIFSALLSILFLGRKMDPYHWLGIALCAAGITAVGSASVLGAPPAAPGADDDSSAALYGVGCVMLAQMIQAAQIVCEERLLKDLELPGTLVVAYEGMWGALIMVVAVFPLMQVLPGNDVGGVQENTYDTLTMLSNSGPLEIMLVVYLFSCSTYNIARMFVTGALSAVHFTMLDASRTALIWVLDLWIMYYAPTRFQHFGEEWTPYSPLQALGFVGLLLGQCVYGGLLKLDTILPMLYPEEEESMDVWRRSMGSVVSPATRHMATPLPPFSPPQAIEKKSSQNKVIFSERDNPLVP